MALAEDFAEVVATDPSARQIANAEPHPRVLTAQWNLDDLVGYLETWSSVQKYLERHAANPLSLVQAELADAWGSPEIVRQVTWPLFLRVGRIE